MENKETIVRETHYEYDENEKLTSMTVHETITNPNDADTDEGEVLTGELEISIEHIFHDVALALAGLGLCLTAVASVLRHR